MPKYLPLGNYIKYKCTCKDNNVSYLANDEFVDRSCNQFCLKSCLHQNNSNSNSNICFTHSQIFSCEAPSKKNKIIYYISCIFIFLACLLGIGLIYYLIIYLNDKFY